MKVKTWGTRGSLAVAGAEHAKYGGNTTCLEILSQCIPGGMGLVVDAGTGFMPFSQSALGRELKRIVILQTHYHHDHTAGLLVAPPVFMDSIQIDIMGPEENGVGPEKAYGMIMRPPLHPVNLDSVLHHMSFKGWKEPATKVVLIHHRGGIKVLSVADFKTAKAESRQVGFTPFAAYAIDECLVITMFWSNHPERTIAYRFEEMPTGRVFTFLTDEEVRAEISSFLREFLRGTHLIVQDAQYTEETYKTKTAGFGHGTPLYAVKLARVCGIEQVGLTHHSPLSNDSEIDALIEEGRAHLVADEKLNLFGCYDNAELEV